MLKRINYLVLLAIALPLAGCANRPEATAPAAAPEIRAGETTLPPTPSPTPLPFTPTETLPAITPSPTPTLQPCLDESAQPIAVPTRQSPLEVRYLSGGDVWLWREDKGEAQQISNTGDAQAFSFSPDGQTVAFARGLPDGKLELWLVQADGSEPRLLLSAETLQEIIGEPTTTEFTYIDSLAFSGWDGSQRLGFEILRSYDAIGGCCDTSGAWQVEIDSGRASPGVLSAQTQLAQDGLLSPDGKQVALLGETGLTLVNADGTHRRENVLTYPYIPQYEGGRFIAPAVSWMPDSQSLAAVTYSEDIWESDATFTTWRVPVDGSPAQQLATFNGLPFTLRISPDQRYLAYLKAVRPASNTRELHLAMLDGTRDVVHSQGPLLEFWGWAPDGVHFVFGEFNLQAPQYGSICGASLPLLDPPAAAFYVFDWLDAQSFLFIHQNPSGAESAELRLGTVGDGSLLIGAYTGEHTSYQVKPVETAP